MKFKTTQPLQRLGWINTNMLKDADAELLDQAKRYENMQQRKLGWQDSSTTAQLVSNGGALMCLTDRTIAVLLWR